MTKYYFLFVFLFFALSIRANDLLSDSIYSETLDEFIVSGLRIEKTKKFISQQIFQLDQNEISFSNSRSTAELLGENGSLFVQKSQQGGGSPNIRGYEASKILLMVDNVRMNNLIFRGGHLQNSIMISPFDIDQLDVVYGPSSVIYGSDALGGVVSYHTPKPQLARNNKISFNGNTIYRYATVNQENTAHTSFNIGLNKIAFYTSLSYSSFGDLKAGRRKNPYLPTDDEYITLKQYVTRKDGKDIVQENDKSYLQRGSNYQQLDFLEKILYQPNDQVAHLLNFQLSTTNNVNRYDRLTDQSKDKPKYAEWYYGPQKRMMGSYTLSLHELLNADKAGLTIAYQNIEESRINRKYNANDRYSRFENVQVISLTSDWQKRINKNFFQFGLDGTLSYLKSTAHATNISTNEQSKLDTRYPSGHNHMHNIEGFATHKYDITDNWHVYEGIRFGYSTLLADFQDRFPGGKVYQNNIVYAASAGINYISSKTKFATNLSTGYRVPNIDDMGKVFDSSADDQIVIVPNKDLKPEESINWDVNLTKYVSDYFQWENVIYATYLFNAIGIAPTTVGGNSEMMYDGEMCKISSNQNNERGFILGYSTNFKIDFLKYFNLKGAFNYTYGRYVNDSKQTPLDHVPPIFGRLGIGYQGLSNKLKAEFFSLFNGKKSLKNYNIAGEDNIRYATILGKDGKGLPAWYTLNFKAGYEINKWINVQMGIENMLNTQYRTFASGINAPGLNTYLSIRLSY